jgi:hypothetical protein
MDKGPTLNRRAQKRVSVQCSADFQVCRVAGFPTRWSSSSGADLEVGDTAGWETCATSRWARHRYNSAGHGSERPGQGGPSHWVNLAIMRGNRVLFEKSVVISSGT